MRFRFETPQQYPISNDNVKPALRTLNFSMDYSGNFADGNQGVFNRQWASTFKETKDMHNKVSKFSDVESQLKQYNESIHPADRKGKILGIEIPDSAKQNHTGDSYLPALRTFSPTTKVRNKSINQQVSEFRKKQY